MAADQESRTIKIGGKEMPVGALPANRVRIRNVDTGEVRDVFSVDWREYDKKRWEQVEQLSGRQIARQSAAPVINPNPTVPTADGDEDDAPAPADPWAGWTDQQMRTAAQEAGVRKADKLDRGGLAAALSKKGVEPGDDKPQG